MRYGLKLRKINGNAGELVADDGLLTQDNVGSTFAYEAFWPDLDKGTYEFILNGDSRKTSGYWINKVGDWHEVGLRPIRLTITV
ncbi:hypothetical protein ACFV9E_40965 [Streptomyces sp. NPDC059835]|uniref:hypothetical protein n=1 Tax=Streptomyces sp. NPDC059835 TaxID=3346967 RepID=UPI003654B6B5